MDLGGEKGTGIFAERRRMKRFVNHKIVKGDVFGDWGFIIPSTRMGIEMQGQKVKGL